MTTNFFLNEPVHERPLNEWGTTAAQLAGAEIRFVEGRRWTHRVIHAGHTGPPLLMYHGIGGHAETYARILPTLARHFRVYAVDAVFHGFSGKNDFDLSTMYDLLAEGFIDLIDALGYRSVLFEGESMGAQMGLTIGMRYPERVERMVLNSGFYLNIPERTDFESAAATAANLGELSTLAVTQPSPTTIGNRLRWLVSRPERMTDDMISVRTHIYRNPEINQSMRKVFNIDAGTFGPHLYEKSFTPEQLREFKPDALVLWGEHNPGHGPDYGRYWADVIGGSFYEIADAGHWPQWEKPDECSAVLLQYLTS